MKLPIVQLNKNEDRRIKAGHVWIYSNEIDTRKTPLAQFEPGQVVKVQNSQSETLGVGYINPNNLLCIRLFSRDPKQILNTDLISEKLRSALALRNALFAKAYYRLVYGESDGLPGLIVDRYDDILVAQISTAGMEKVKEEIVAALVDVIQPSAILWRNDNAIRELENLPRYVETAWGEPPDRVDLEENDVKFQTSIRRGQKTGWFYDHRDNRARLKNFVPNKRVLDLFSYVGGWGIQAAAFGANEVYCVDSSGQALENLRRNAQLNQVTERVHTLEEDAFAALKTLQQKNESFDVIIVDPPAFIKKRKDVKEGVIAYQRINEAAMRLLADEGILISSSCSLHFSKDMLQQVLLRSSLKCQRRLQIIGQGHQGPDHPVHPAIPETDYLKTLFCRLENKK